LVNHSRNAGKHFWTIFSSPGHFSLPFRGTAHCVVPDFGIVPIEAFSSD
jgi:hypothetical protein